MWSGRNYDLLYVYIVFVTSRTTVDQVREQNLKFKKQRFHKNIAVIFNSGSQLFELGHTEA